MIVDLLNNSLQFTDTPVWFMRQAGRYLPEYKKIRQKKDTFLDLCFDSKLAAEVSLQPIIRFDIDAIIFFSDILVIPHALNQTVSFIDGVGPKLNPITSPDDLDLPTKTIFLEKLKPCFNTLKIIKKKKSDQKNLIGFCGSPLTVLTYMIEGKTSKNHLKTKQLIKNDRKNFDKLIEILVDYSIIYLDEQIKAGAEIIQLFESWASIVNQTDFDKYVIDPNKEIVKRIKRIHPKIPIICFPRNNPEKLSDFIKNVDCDVISVDLQISEDVKSFCIRKNIAIQGNLDPLILMQGGSILSQKVNEILMQFKKNKHIFNLSHGILPKTPISHVEETIKQIRQYDKTRNSS